MLDDHLFWAPGSPGRLELGWIQTLFLWILKSLDFGIYRAKIDLNPLDYGIWAQMKQYIFDRRALTTDAVLAAVDSFFNTHQQQIKDCILGAERLEDL